MLLDREVQHRLGETRIHERHAQPGFLRRQGSIADAFQCEPKGAHAATASVSSHGIGESCGIGDGRHPVERFRPRDERVSDRDQVGDAQGCAELSPDILGFDHAQPVDVREPLTAVRELMGVDPGDLRRPIRLEHADLRFARGREGNRQAVDHSGRPVAEVRSAGENARERRAKLQMIVEIHIDAAHAVEGSLQADAVELLTRDAGGDRIPNAESRARQSCGRYSLDIHGGQPVGHRVCRRAYPQSLRRSAAAPHL